ncbi:unnamed protein product [Ostreobium quekettii]|uniref:peptidylprolyl isomerase n=1 Tax=Ostreobium quekettii TaxID=121088 RepID=A0A8S1IZH9_9CHLO|nr:unnamed protein product [Ostreobium quekettii]|eukprot:evm.model.scf_1378.3 EVM.evm.TU.scf_1378.3   scf_1378:22677-27260(+)
MPATALASSTFALSGSRPRAGLRHVRGREALRASPATGPSRSAPTSEADPSRRSALLSGAVVAGSAWIGRPGIVAAADCEFQSSPSGLEFCDLKEGSGPEPTKGAKIKAHYTGRLDSNGKVFDSSYDRGSPLAFQVGVGQVIKGWDMGILGTDGIPPMKPGGQRKLRIPSELAYGSRSVGGGLIPANSVLVFDVEYLGLA